MCTEGGELQNTKKTPHKQKVKEKLETQQGGGGGGAGGGGGGGVGVELVNTGPQCVRSFCSTFWPFQTVETDILRSATGFDNPSNNPQDIRHKGRTFELDFSL